MDTDEDWQQFWRALGIIIGIVLTIFIAAMCAATVSASCWGGPCPDVRLPTAWYAHDGSGFVLTVDSLADEAYIIIEPRGEVYGPPPVVRLTPGAPVTILETWPDAAAQRRTTLWPRYSTFLPVVR